MSKSKMTQERVFDRVEKNINQLLENGFPYLVKKTNSIYKTKGGG